MKLREYITVIFDKVIIYEEIGNGEFHDIYKGEKSNIPYNILEMEVRNIGAKREGILDVQIRTHE